MSNELVQTEEQQDAASNMIQVIERAASNPDVDVDKLERMLAVQERILERNAEQEFNLAMKAAQEEMPRVLRDAENQQTRSKYARLETVARAINPTITKHGFSMSFGTADSTLDNHYRVTCTVSHIGGHSRQYHADIPADATGLKGNANKTATHAFGSTMSYGRRYLTLLIFNVTLTDEDDDGNSANGVIDEHQKETIIQKIIEVEADTAKFLKYMGVDSVDNIADKDYRKAMNALEAKAKKT